MIQGVASAFGVVGAVSLTFCTGAAVCARGAESPVVGSTGACTIGACATGATGVGAGVACLAAILSALCC